MNEDMEKMARRVFVVVVKEEVVVMVKEEVAEIVSLGDEGERAWWWGLRRMWPIFF